MTSAYRKLMTTCLAAVLAFGLAACGGGGGGTAPPVPDPAEEQRKTATAAIAAATAAVAGLTAMSSDADVAAAQAAITAAESAVAAATDVPAAEVATMTGSINVEKTKLAFAEQQIASYRQSTHDTQLAAAQTAVGAATAAVGGLTDMSSDADVAAAESAIAAAKAAVMAGTMLTDAEMATLNGAIAAAETNLMTAESNIADYRTHQSQHAAAMNAASAATMAVAGLNDMSTAAEVAAAESAIAAAKAAVTAGTMLTPSEVARLNGEIALVEVDLTTTKTAIADRARNEQHVAAMNAVSAAEMAVAALTDTSTQAEVDAAQDLIDAAKTVVMAGTMLTAGQVAMLNDDISDVETDLGTIGDLRTAQEIVRLHEEASGATMDAEAAGEKATMAVATAKEYDDKLDVASVKGDSSAAKANAKKVLDARIGADQAVLDAEAAKARADTAKSDAGDIADGTAGKTEVVTAIDEAIKEAEAQIAATKAISTGKNADGTPNQDGQDLKTAVLAVTGSDEDDLKDDTDVAEGVAMAVAGALLATNTNAGSLDGTPVRVTHYATEATLTAATPPAIKDRTFHDHDSSGMTWENIVGGANVVRERLGTVSGNALTAGNGVVPVALIAGMDADVVNPAEDDLSGTGGSDGGNTYGDEFSTDAADINYRGIPGVVVCLGDDCKVGVAADGINEGKLIGSWYFTPSSTTDVYIPNPDEDARVATPYVQDNNFAQWGHWLTVATDGTGNVTIHTYATSGANLQNLNLGVPAGSLTDTETATFTGDAAGMSVHKELDTDGKQLSISSGAFTAEVELTARFGTAPTLQGMIDNFRGGAHTDSDWEVKLQEEPLDTTSAAFTSGMLGVAKGSGQGGDWTAQGYGPAQTTVDGATVNHRPSGFFGKFNAHFTDGHAAGAYVARK